MYRGVQWIAVFNVPRVQWIAVFNVPRCSMDRGVQCTAVFNGSRCSMYRGVQWIAVFNVPRCSMDRGVQCTAVFNVSRCSMYRGVPTCSIKVLATDTVAGLSVLPPAVSAAVVWRWAVTTTDSLLRSFATLLRAASPLRPLAPLSVDGVYTHIHST